MAGALPGKLILTMLALAGCGDDNGGHRPMDAGATVEAAADAENPDAGRERPGDLCPEQAGETAADGASQDGPGSDADIDIALAGDDARALDVGDEAGEGGRSELCDLLSAYAGTSLDAAAVIQACIDGTADGDTLTLPAGRFRIARQIVVARPIHLTTRGKSADDPPCDVDNGARDCFEVIAAPTFLIDDPAQPGLLWVPPSAAGAALDHLIFNGNKQERLASASAAHCTGDGNPAQAEITYGYNVTLAADRVRLTNSVSRDALCGTGMEVDGKYGLAILNNRFVGNGVHDRFLLWADGLTVTDAVASTISGNLAVDNSDIDIILGGGRGSVVRDNVIAHGDDFATSSFAALMLTVWNPPTVPTSTGDFTGADIAGNEIDCGTGKRCGFGLEIGTDPWLPDEPLFGGEVHDNVIRNAQQGLNVAHTSGPMHVYDNRVTDSGGDFVTTCGTRRMGAYNISPGSLVDRTGDDSADDVYTHEAWTGCLPNPPPSPP